MLGILEPRPKLHPEIETSQIDVFLCPGLAFGHDGSRLGHGGGYYDRTLENFSGKICGIALNAQILETVPHTDHDVIMQHIITETGITPAKSH